MFRKRLVYYSAYCRYHITGGIDVVKYILRRISQTRKTDLGNEIHHLAESIQTLYARIVVTQAASTVQNT